MTTLTHCGESHHFAIGWLVLLVLRRHLRASLTFRVATPDLGKAECVTLHMVTESDIFVLIVNIKANFLNRLLFFWTHLLFIILSSNLGKANIYFTFIFKIYWHYGCFWVV